MFDFFFSDYVFGGLIGATLALDFASFIEGCPHFVCQQEAPIMFPYFVLAAFFLAVYSLIRLALRVAASRF